MKTAAYIGKLTGAGVDPKLVQAHGRHSKRRSPTVT